MLWGSHGQCSKGHVVLHGLRHWTKWLVFSRVHGIPKDNSNLARTKALSDTQTWNWIQVTWAKIDWHPLNYRFLKSIIILRFWSLQSVLFGTHWWSYSHSPGGCCGIRVIMSKGLLCRLGSNFFPFMFSVSHGGGLISQLSMVLVTPFITISSLSGKWLVSFTLVFLAHSLCSFNDSPENMMVQKVISPTFVLFECVTA